MLGLPARDVCDTARGGERLAVLFPLLVQKTLIKPAFDGWTSREVELLLRRSAGSPATHWAVIFTVVVVIVLAATIQYVWPFSPTVAVGATVFTAAVLAWVAQHTHRRRGIECAQRPYTGGFRHARPAQISGA